VLVVSGGDRVPVEEIAAACGARTVFNPQYATEEMLTSIRVGLRAMPAESEAAFVALGDQPQILPGTVRLLADEYSRGHAALVVPSYQLRRGHPWLVSRTLWNDVLSLQAPETARDFLRMHAGSIVHVNVDTPTILADLDTPEDYLKSDA
jgi:molybdenum cofactor cytidylyltransferase